MIGLVSNCASGDECPSLPALAETCLRTVRGGGVGESFDRMISSMSWVYGTGKGGKGCRLLLTGYAQDSKNSISRAC